MNEPKKVYVYDSFTSDTPVLFGILYVDPIKGNETYSFEYDSDYLKKKEI